MNAHFPPFTKPTGAYDAAKLREDTIALAVSQDRDNDALPSILADMRALVARLERYAERKPAYPSAEGLTTRVIKANPQQELPEGWLRVTPRGIAADPEHLAWHVTGDGADFSVERDSNGSRL